MLMEYYRNFLTIVECGSILAASRKLNIAQPALSHQLKMIEEDYGTQLLIRGSRNVTLTEAGDIFYRNARSLCSLDRDMREEIRKNVGGVQGTLTMALSPTNTTHFLRSLFERFFQRYPRVDLHIVESAAPDLPRLVKSGAAEIGYIRTPFYNTFQFKEFNHYQSASDFMCAAVPRGHPLFEREELDFNILREMEIVIPISLVTYVQEMGWKAGFMPDYAVTTTSRHVAVEMAKLRGLVAVVVAGLVNPIEDENVRLIPFQGPGLEIPRGFISNKGLPLSNVAKNFFDCYAENEPVFAASWASAKEKGRL